jgi:hypothetical protein
MSQAAAAMTQAAAALVTRRRKRKTYGACCYVPHLSYQKKTIPDWSEIEWKESGLDYIDYVVFSLLLKVEGEQ